MKIFYKLDQTTLDVYLHSGPEDTTEISIKIEGEDTPTPDFNSKFGLTMFRTYFISDDAIAKAIVSHMGRVATEQLNSVTMVNVNGREHAALKIAIVQAVEEKNQKICCIM